MPIAIPFDEDGTAVLVPNFAPDGSALDEPAAIEQYKKTGKHFGKFDTSDNARAYAEELSQTYTQPPPGGTPATPPAAPAATAPPALGELRTRRGAPVIAPPITPTAPPASEVTRSAGPPMQSLEERLGSIPEVNPATGAPLTFDQRALAEQYVTQDYHKEQQRTEEQRARLGKTLTDGTAMLADGKPFEYSEAEIRSLLPPEKADPFVQQLTDAKTAGRYVGSVRISSPDELKKQRDKLTAAMNDPSATDYVRRRKLLEVYDGLTTKHFEELGKDPAGYVARYSQPIADAYAAIDPRNPQTFADYANIALAEQARLGVPTQMRAILPTGVAAQKAAQIAALDPATTKPVDEMRALAASLGSYWPQVFGELVKAKLPGAYQVLATMDRPNQAVAAHDLSLSLSEVAKKGGMEAVKAAAPDEKKKAIDKTLGTELEEFGRSVSLQPGGEDLYKHVEDAARLLAYRYVFQGQSDTDAVRHAVDGIIRNKYDFGELGAGTVRVPKDMYGVVATAADALRNAVVPDELPPIAGSALWTPAQRRDMWMDAIGRGGWVNNNDDSGIVLTARLRDGAPLAVHRADGSRVEFKFSDAPAIAKASPMPIPTNPEDIGARPGQR